ncbi:MAG TPA: adenosylcobinamide-phosphate synthase CbiB [Lachnospiraceae bacterium]|nr:adenosylcobinamide-phosphate synthase CbiB [Lachnospiraceae bacterium]
MRYSLYALLIGFVLDLLFGDPHWLYHPIRFIGSFISKMERILRRVFPATSKGELIGGLTLVIIIVSSSTAVPILILHYAYQFNSYFGLGIESVMCYQLLATKSLRVESMKVYHKLKEKDIEGARYAVSMIVGRETKSLDEIGITKAAVETVAENTSDGIIAPLIFMMIGGAPLGFFYKAVNTMDSMIGYKSDRFLYFGRTAARFDDVLNYIPARFSAYMMILSASVLRMNPRNAYRIYKRDRYKHASPNSAQTESVCAGALGVELAGDAYYFGELHRKEYIGDKLRDVTIEDIRLANRLLYTCASLSVVILAVVKYLILSVAW